MWHEAFALQPRPVFQSHAAGLLFEEVSLQAHLVGEPPDVHQLGLADVQAPLALLEAVPLREHQVGRPAVADLAPDAGRHVVLPQTAVLADAEDVVLLDNPQKPPGQTGLGPVPAGVAVVELVVVFDDDHISRSRRALVERPVQGR